MRLEETIEFNESEYRSKVQSYSNEQLRAQEVRKTQQVLHNAAGTGSGAAAAAMDPTMISAVVLGISSRSTDVAERKLKILAEEVERRGLMKHEVDSNDYGAAALSFLVGEAAGDLGENAADLNGGNDNQAVTMGAVSGEMAGDKTLEQFHPEIPNARPAQVSLQQASPDSRPPPKANCARLKPFNRLHCNGSGCERYFDPRFEEYLHCCLCNDDYDVCGTCKARNITTCASLAQHRLSLGPRGQQPKVKESNRAMFGSLKCSGCQVKIKHVQFYGCETCYDSLDEYDVCLPCFEKGRACPKHAATGLVRKST